MASPGNRHCANCIDSRSLLTQLAARAGIHRTLGDDLRYFRSVGVFMCCVCDFTNNNNNNNALSASEMTKIYSYFTVLMYTVLGVVVESNVINTFIRQQGRKTDRSIQ